jgi:succinoglycan biosynthesis transport protein ExoP
MLDSNNGRGLITAKPPSIEADEPSAAEAIANILGIIRRQLLLVVVLGVIGGVLGVVFLLKAQPPFTATTTLLINTHKMDIFQQPTVSDELPIQAMGAVESQIELFRSDAVALRVIKKLNLVNDPRFIDHSSRRFFSSLLHRLAPSYYSESLSDSDRQNLTLKLFNSNLTVERIGVTYAIEIKFQSTDPELAAQVANAVADAYIDLQRTSEYDAARRASDWLEDRMPELRAKSEAAQKAVGQYRQEHNIVETSGGQTIEEQRLTDMNLKLTAARDETLKAKEKADQFAAFDGTDFLSTLGSGSNASGVATDSLDKLRSQYFDIASKLAESFGHLGANNPTIVSLRNQEAQLRSEIMTAIQHLKQASESDYAAAQKREAGLKSDFDAAVAQAHGAKEAQVKLQELEASAHAYQDLYTTYVNRYNSSLQQAVSPVAEASIITPATPLMQRDYKKTIQLAVLFPLAGVMLGLGIGLLREVLAERVFLTSKSIQSRLRIACIGLLPKEKSKRRWRLGKARDGAEPRTLVHGDRGIAWTVVERPFSQFSEGVRSIKFAIDLESRSRSSRVIGITSALPNEGKSTVALAVAQMIASNGASTILVDCDLRNPSLTRSIAPNAASGIIDLAFGQTSLEHAIWKDQSTQMAFIPAIPRQAPPDPTSALSSTELRQVFDRLREQYQFVIVDLSPLVPVIDVYATIDFVDAYVLVIEWGQTNVDIVKRALRSVPTVSEGIIGAVLNKVEIKSLATYDPYASSYYFDNGEGT